MWADELDEIREHMKKTRATLASARINSIPMHPIGAQKGMFTSLPLAEIKVVRLREEFGVYMTDAARINVAGLPANEVDRFIEALKAVA
jgi:aromatic-amino-acid transaminase